MPSWQQRKAGLEYKKGRHAGEIIFLVVWSQTVAIFFWCDPAPVFGKRGGGSAMLGGEIVDYYRMYEAPLRMRGSGAGRRVSGYMSVADEDPEAGV